METSTAKLRRHRNKDRNKRRNCKRVIILARSLEGVHGTIKWEKNYPKVGTLVGVQFRINGSQHLFPLAEHEIRPLHMNGNGGNGKH